MNQFMLSLTFVFLSTSILFASKNRPIYTVKDGNLHTSYGPNQDKCSQTSFYWREDGKIAVDEQKNVMNLMTVKKTVVKNNSVLAGITYLRATNIHLINSVSVLEEL